MRKSSLQLMVTLLITLFAESVSADAYALTYLMRGVVEEGTARRVQELGWPAIGKTGTMNDFKDVWFEGCTPAHPTDVAPFDFPVPPDVNMVRKPGGQLVPYQRGRVPTKYLKGVGSITLTSTIVIPKL